MLNGNPRCLFLMRDLGSENVEDKLHCMGFTVETITVFI